MLWYLRWLHGARGTLLVFAAREVSLVLRLVEVLSVFVNANNAHDVAVDIDRFIGEDFIASQVVIADVGLAGLFNLGCLR